MDRHPRRILRLVACASVLCLPGCAGMEDAGQKLKGQDTAVVVAKLGYPNEKREMLGHTIYRWNTGNPDAMYCNLDVGVSSAQHDPVMELGRKQRWVRLAREQATVKRP